MRVCSVGKPESWGTLTDLDEGSKAVLSACHQLRVRAQKDLLLSEDAAQLCTVLLQDVLTDVYAKSQAFVLSPKDPLHPGLPPSAAQAIYQVCF